MATLGSTPISTHYFQLQIGGDLALLKGICKRLIEMDDTARQEKRAGILDAAFIAAHTSGFDSFAADVRAESWAVIVGESGLSHDQIDEAALLYAQSERVIACWGMALRNTNARWPRFR